jgi:hypothetical protein
MTAAVSSSTLSRGDEQILAQVFDPESSPDTPQCKIDLTLPADPYITEVDALRKLKKWELEAIMFIEQYSTSATKPSIFSNVSRSDEDDMSKHGVYLQAMAILTNLTDAYPNYASAFNNRAQVRRWRYGERIFSSEPEASEALDNTVEDLTTAIELVSPSTSTASVSPAQAKLLGQAWTQKGAVLWGLSRKQSSATSVPATSASSSLDYHFDDRNGHAPDRLDDSKGIMDPEAGVDRPRPEHRTWDQMRLEEEGSRCFFMAGLYGSEIGRSMAVKTNPYARLCGSIVKEALRREGAV